MDKLMAAIIICGGLSLWCTGMTIVTYLFSTKQMESNEEFIKDMREIFKATDNKKEEG